MYSICVSSNYHQLLLLGCLLSKGGHVIFNLCNNRQADDTSADSEELKNGPYPTLSGGWSVLDQ